MPSSRLQRRALAALGALLLVISVWPFTCAAIPISLLTFQSNNSELTLNNVKGTSEKPSEWTKFLSVLNKSNDTNRKMNKLPINNMFVATKRNTQRNLHPRRKRKKFVEITTVLPPDTTIKTNLNNYKTEKTIVSHDEDVFKFKYNSLSELNLESTTATTKSELQHKMQNVFQFNSQITESIKLNHRSFDNNDDSSTVVENIISTTTITNHLSDVSMAGKSGTTHTLLSVFLKNNKNGTILHKSTISSTNESALSRTERSVQSSNRKKNSNLERNERSANLSHITGTARKIQLLIKNRLLQLLPDGTVNGTQDDGSEYTILQRGAVDVGQIRIQGVATCLFLCMDACGNVYGAKEFTDDCIFNETMQENFNIYSSSFHSNTQKTFYLALNKLGQTRKTHLPANKELGKLATYAKSFTFTVPEKKSEDLIAKLFGKNHIKHGLKQLCDSGKSLVELTAKKLKPKMKCGKKLKGKRPLPTVLLDRNKKVGPKCTDDNCTKKKKNIQKNAGRGGTANGSGPKHKLKKTHNNKKNNKKLKSKEFTTPTTTTTDKISLTTPGNEDDSSENNEFIVSSTETHDDDDEWEETTVPSVGQTALVEDDGDLDV